jgi:lysophospholipase L1-like esterase
VRLRALVTSLTAVAGLLAAGVVLDPPPAQAQDCARPHGPLVAYGHSYLLSPGIGGATASYASLAASSMDIEAVIRAVNGGTTQDTAKLVRSGSTKWQPGSADLVVVDSAINDIYKRVPTARWTASLRSILSTLSEGKAPVILLLRPLPVAAAAHPGHNPTVIAAYAAQQRTVVSEFPAVRIVDASSGWNPRLDLSATDGIHPNPVGELHLAKAVEGVATRAYCSP